MRGGRAIRVCDLKYKGNLHPKTGHLKILRSPRLCLVDIQMFRRHVIIWMIQDWQLSSIRNTELRQGWIPWIAACFSTSFLLWLFFQCTCHPLSQVQVLLSPVYSLIFYKGKALFYFVYSEAIYMEITLINLFLGVLRIAGQFHNISFSPNPWKNYSGVWKGTWMVKTVVLLHMLPVRGLDMDI